MGSQKSAMDIDLISAGSMVFIIGFFGYFHFKRRWHFIKDKIPFDPDESIFESFAPKPNPESTPDILKKIESLIISDLDKNEIKQNRYIEENPINIGLVELKMKVFILIAMLGIILITIGIISPN